MTRTHGKKFKDMFLVKIASKGTSLEIKLLAISMNITNDSRQFRFFFGPFNNKWLQSNLSVQKNLHIRIRIPFHLSYELLIMILLEKVAS